LCCPRRFCLLVALPVTNTVHAICGKSCEDAGISYHTTCFKFFKNYGVTFKDPEDFLTIKGLQIHSGEEQDKSILQAGNEDGRNEAEFSYLCNKDETTPPNTTKATAVSAAIQG
jgi:hypothetical protein